MRVLAGAITVLLIDRNLNTIFFILREEKILFYTFVLIF